MTSTFLWVTIMLALSYHIQPNISADSRESNLRRIGDYKLESKCLKVPVEEFNGSVKKAVGVVKEVVSSLSRFSGKTNVFRVSNAIADCLDLMDLSLDQLSKALHASQNQDGSGNLCDDLRTWLSGTLTNPDTCKEGFDGTSSTILCSISGGLDRLASLVHNILSVVKPNPIQRHIHGEFPHWLKPLDREFIHSPNKAIADAVVAKDGTGNYTSIVDAIAAAPDHSKKRYVIHVKNGTYNEYVYIGKKKWNIMLIGDGMDVTVISGNHNFVDGWTTFHSATFAVSGQGFIARDITFENTAGPAKHQAVAFRSSSDVSVLYRCAFRGYQDTLYAHSQLQFYRECQITGTVDFIFGRGKVVFQNCQILGRKCLPHQKNTITAQGRKYQTEDSGFVIQFCNISVEPNVLKTTATYLGRPWKLYSFTIIMQSTISDAIRPEGWLEWNGNFALDTLYYGEYMNNGPGARVGSRVKWPGYHIFNASRQVSDFTVGQLLSGDSWLPSTGIPYTSGLTPKRSMIV